MRVAIIRIGIMNDGPDSFSDRRICWVLNIFLHSRFLNSVIMATCFMLTDSIHHTLMFWSWLIIVPGSGMWKHQKNDIKLKGQILPQHLSWAMSSWNFQWFTGMFFQQALLFFLITLIPDTLHLFLFEWWNNKFDGKVGWWELMALTKVGIKWVCPCCSWFWWTKAAVDREICAGWAFHAFRCYWTAETLYNARWLFGVDTEVMIDTSGFFHVDLAHGCWPQAKTTYLLISQISRVI